MALENSLGLGFSLWGKAHNELSEENGINDLAKNKFIAIKY